VNLNDLSTQLLFTTVPLWVKKAQGTVTGTGFIYNVPLPGDPTKLIPLLITNFHVVEAASDAVIELVERKGDAPILQNRVRAQISPSVLLAATDQRLDLAIIPLGPLLNQLEASGRPAFFRAVGPEIIPSAEVVQDLSAVEEIVFIGYPSGLRDEHNSTPLIRRGITASPVWNDFGNEPVFLIDAGVYPGSSGSPVFIMNQGAYATRSGLTVGTRLLFLGLITSTILRNETAGNAYLGLGRVVKASAIAPAIDSFVRQVQASQNK
jgi:S1-C subfamily serine protease